MNDKNESPFKVDIDAIASRLLEMINEHKDGACMSLGMFPAEIMESFEGSLKRKIPDCYQWTHGDGEVTGHEDGKSIRRGIRKDVCGAVLRLACASGKCLV